MSDVTSASQDVSATAIDVTLREALTALRADRPQAAADLLDRLLVEAPGEPLALVLRARAARLNDEFDVAEELLTQARGMLGDHPQLVAELGYIALARGNASAAVRNFELLTSLLPAHPIAHFNLGLAYRAKGRYAAALVSIERALALEIDAPAEAHAELGSVLLQTRRTDEARRQLERARALDPQCPRALTASGAFAAACGDFDTAAAQFRAALEADPEHAEAWLRLAHTRRFGGDADEDIERMEGLLEAPGTAPEARLKLHFALGKARDDGEDHERAFAHFDQANRIAHRRALAYDAARHEKIVTALIESCDDDFLRRAGTTVDTEAAANGPLFVVGMPRSGATLIELSLASHSGVTMGGPLPYFDRIAHMRLTPWPDALARLRTQAGQAIASEYRDVLHAIDPGVRVTNRHPANIMHLGLIAALLPDATLIHCERDPLDTCLSIFFNDLPAESTYAHRLDDIAHVLLQYRRLMAHWHALLGERLLRVSYEDFVIDPQAGVETILAHAGLPFEDSCLRPHETDEVVTTTSNWQVRQPVHIGSCERWRHYAAHLETVAATLGAAVE